MKISFHITVLQVLFLEDTKRNIYYKLLEENPGLKLSISKFYKLVPKYFKKAKKATDICPVCDKGKKLIKKIENLKKKYPGGNDFINKLQEQVKLFQTHKEIKERQKDYYEKSLLKTTPFSCVVVMDFKENFKIGGGPIETGQQYYRKSQISDLGFAIQYKGVDNLLKVKYFNFFSEILSHDSLFVTDCISQLLQQPFMQRFQEICFWSDSGPHFRSAEMAHFFMKQLPSQYRGKIYFFNYFTEYHGKSLVDGHFGLLSRWFADGEACQDIKSIEDLISLFRNKVSIQQNHTSNFLDANFTVYERPEGRGKIHKLIVENFKSFMSFVVLEGKFLVCPLSTLDGRDYIVPNVQLKVETDKRKTKFAPERGQISSEFDLVMGSASQKMLLTRSNLIIKLSNSSSDEDPMELD